ncbi:transcription factor atf31 [Schizosaccharomyces japonicus yFS275]|uniref:Transcription factor atf31 n=1 Tax=Schizosaccharomyces japonicus (strain yFS275 / FY16936) TaxID=402676 RepID=B6JX51_SCHJY|nr:transcription factor atf31 [Schizosaccharomyces japonicus yFS275]EEB05952.2 transcription factor atf31 [Schizosaccharomyces japonicus yFS275]
MNFTMDTNVPMSNAEADTLKLVNDPSFLLFSDQSQPDKMPNMNYLNPQAESLEWGSFDKVEPSQSLGFSPSPAYPLDMKDEKQNLDLPILKPDFDIESSPASQFMMSQDGHYSESVNDGMTPRKSMSRKEYLRQRNREAAYKCRQRKKQWISELQAKVEYFNIENKSLLAQANMLREEIVNLKMLLVAHKDCPLSMKTLESSKIFDH